MKVRIPLILIACLLTIISGSISYAQSPKKWRLICARNINISMSETDCQNAMNVYEVMVPFIEVKSSNPKYSKVMLEGRIIAGYSSLITTYDTSFMGTIDKRTNGNGTYNYLYKAYVEYNPDDNGFKKSQTILFFSAYNAGFNGSKTPAFAKEVLSDMDKKSFLLQELYPDKYLEVDEYAYSNSSVQKKAYATSTKIYDPNSIYPHIEFKLIGEKQDFKLNLSHSKNYVKSTQVNFNDLGKPKELIEYFQKDGGRTLPLKRIEKLDESGKVTEVNFNNFYGANLVTGDIYFKTVFHIPTGIQNRWKPSDFKVEPDLISDLFQSLNRDPIEDKDLLLLFLSNFQRLDEQIYLDNNDLVGYYKSPKKYIYKGTFNKDGLPHGWGLMYVENIFEDEYYLGHFNHGKPDGFGIRKNFNFDKPESNFTSIGFHVGNKLIFGSKISIPANNYGFNVAYGDFREGQLNGKGSKIWDSASGNGIGVLTYGYFQNGELHGKGQYYSTEKVESGEFENGKFMSGSSQSDKTFNNNFYPGVVVMYQGKKYVIMKKENGIFTFDNGLSVSTKANVTLTGERSVRSKACLICNGTGFLNPTTKTVFSGVTKKTKSYETGPTGYILWEKTTTTTTAPITSTQTLRCTACSGGYAGNEPIPLKANQK